MDLPQAFPLHHVVEPFLVQQENMRSQGLFRMTFPAQMFVRAVLMVKLHHQEARLVLPV
jgi:hypothetical protein